jgi:broad specificity phosphatase PhoE
MQQCEHVKSNPTLKTVQIVLVSPLHRALQTAEIVFGKLNIPIVVVPELTESFRYGCDLSGRLEEKPKIFKSINF